MRLHHNLLAVGRVVVVVVVVLVVVAVVKWEWLPQLPHYPDHVDASDILGSIPVGLPFSQHGMLHILRTHTHHTHHTHAGIILSLQHLQWWQPARMSCGRWVVAVGCGRRLQLRLQCDASCQLPVCQFPSFPAASVAASSPDSHLAHSYCDFISNNFHFSFDHPQNKTAQPQPTSHTTLFNAVCYVSQGKWPQIERA